MVDLFGRPAGYFEQRKEDMLKYIPPGVKKTLELGCAFGNFSELARRNEMQNMCE